MGTGEPAVERVVVTKAVGVEVAEGTAEAMACARHIRDTNKTSTVGGVRHV